MKNEKKMGVFSFPYVIWMAIFVIVPLLIMAYYGFTTKEGSFTWDNVLSIADPIHRKALWTSIRLSVICTVICFLLALPLAMVIRGLHIKSSGFIIFVFIRLLQPLPFLLCGLLFFSEPCSSLACPSALAGLHMNPQ